MSTEYTWKDKVTSGRRIWAAVGAVTFGYCAAAGVIEADDVVKVLLVIVMFYFQKDRSNGTQ